MTLTPKAANSAIRKLFPVAPVMCIVAEETCEATGRIKKFLVRLDYGAAGLIFPTPTAEFVIEVDGRTVVEFEMDYGMEAIAAYNSIDLTQPNFDQPENQP